MSGYFGLYAHFTIIDCFRKVDFFGGGGCGFWSFWVEFLAFFIAFLRWSQQVPSHYYDKATTSLGSSHYADGLRLAAHLHA